MHFALIGIISLLPVLGWGFMPILAKRSGGTAKESMLGTTLIVLLTMFLFSLFSRMNYDLVPFVIGICSGVFWGFGQWLQFEAIDRSDVSKVMPLSNGSQLLLTTLFAWVFLGERYSGWTAVIVFVCLLLIIIGVALSTKTSSDQEYKISKTVFLSVFLSSVFLACYVTIPNFFDINDSALFFPQAIGMFVVAVCLNLKNRSKINNQNVLRNFSTGISWLIANVSLFFVSDYLGLGLAFTISQMCVLVSVYGSIVILKDRKSKKDMNNVYLGTLLMVVGLIIFGLVK